MTDELELIADEPVELADDALISVLEQRTTEYQPLSRLYIREVDQELLDEMHEMLYPMDTGDDKVDKGFLYIATFLSNLWAESLQELAADFVRTFMGHGLDAYSAAYPYESVYTSEKRLLMQDARDEVLHIYRANQLKRQDTWKEGEDHIALEMEFMQIMNDRSIEALRAGDEAEAVRLIAIQRDFLREHLAAWVPMMTADMKRFAETKMYLGLAWLTEGFLRTDLALLNDLLSEDAE